MAELRLKQLNMVCPKWIDFSDEYLVGDNGHLYSMHNGKLRMLKSGHYRSGKKYGYQQVRNLFGTTKRHTVKVHRAVAMAFVPRREHCNDVDHINNDKSDNRAVNLQWLTHEENLRKMRRRQKGEEE